MQINVHCQRQPRCRIRRRQLLFFCVLLLAAIPAFSQNISLNLKDVPLEKAFRAVESKTPYRFVYTREMLSESGLVSIEADNQPIQKVVSLLLTGQPLAYTIDGNHIILTVRTALPPATRPAFVTIEGRVTDDQGTPIAGVTVQVKPGGKATATDNLGAFFLQEIDPQATLFFSNVGYQPQAIKLEGRTFIQVSLEIAYDLLDETVVIAYGTTTKRFNTGSVSKLSAAEIIHQPVSNPLAALSGRIPGLFITQSNGLPGSNFQVLIRGQNSIQNGNAPLYIIDGVPFLNHNDRLAQRSGINATNPLNSINPADIESIEVLKDADATAIYGSRGANGVILISTKKGQGGKTGLDVNVYKGWGRVTRTVDYLQTADYIRMRRAAFQNDGRNPTLFNAPDLLAWDTTRYTDLKEMLIGGTAQFASAQARLSGGNAATQFSLSTGYRKETTVFPGDQFGRVVTLDLNLSHSSADQRFSASFTTGFANDQSRLINHDITSFINMAPNLPPLYDATGRLNWEENNAAFSNPLALLLQPYKAENIRLTSQALLNYKLHPALTLKLSAGYNSLHFTETSQTPIASQNPAYNPKGSAVFGSNAFQGWILEPQVQYQKGLGKNSRVEFLAGTTWHHTANKSLVTEGFGYTNDDLLGAISGAATILSTNDAAAYRYSAVFARLNLNLKKTYLLNITARRDGSSRFGPGRQFANFGAFGGAWIFTEERGMKKMTPVLSFGKLRASYGITGNDQINNYQYLDSWTTTQYPYGQESALRPLRLYNPDYGWEQTQKMDLALELGLLKDRILFNINWFQNRSGNQIINYILPAQTGFRTVLRNFPGLVQNQGIELELKTINWSGKNFSWSTSFNITSSNNKLLRFPQLETSSYANSYAIGQPLNLKIGYRFEGVDPKTGVYTFEDVNKDGLMDRQDYQLLGTTNPRYYGGLLNNLQFKNWQLQCFFSFVNQKGMHPVYSNFIPAGFQANQPILILDHWRQEGDIAAYQMFTQRSGTPAFRAGNNLLPYSDATLTDASYIRLKNLSLSYLLPAAYLKKLGFAQVRLYGEGQNLATITNYKGADPESQSLQALPPLKVFTVGLQFIL